VGGLTGKAGDMSTFAVRGLLNIVVVLLALVFLVLLLG
jgi:hypothetical protein